MINPVVDHLLQDVEISVSPQPACGEFQIVTNLPPELIREIKLYDLFGRLVNQFNINETLKYNTGNISPEYMC
jgi:hypothetical protein